MFFVDQLGGTWKLRDVSKRLEVEPLKPDVMFVVVSLVGLGFRKRFSPVFLGFLCFFYVHHSLYIALL